MKIVEVKPVCGTGSEYSQMQAVTWPLARYASVRPGWELLEHPTHSPKLLCDVMRLVPPERWSTVALRLDGGI
jgi:hypothetical protein